MKVLKNIKIQTLMILILLMSVSFFIRSYKLSDLSLYGDEPFSIFYAQQTLSDYKKIYLYDSNPPLHIVLLHFWQKICGISDFSAKIFSVLFSLLAGFFLFLFCKKYLNLFAAFLASFLFLFSNAQQFFATEIRPYALVQLLCILSLYAYFGLLNKPQKKYILFLFLANVGLLYTHYLTVFVLFVEFVFIWLYINKNRKAFVYYLISQIILVIAFIPWISILFSNMPKKGSFWWISKPNYDSFRWHTNILVGNELLFYVFNGLLILFLLLLILNRYKKILSDNFNIIHWGFFLGLYILPIGLNYLVSQKYPVFVTRYMLYSTFGLFLCVSYFFSNLKLKPVYLSLLLSPFALIILSSFKIIQKREDDWKRMVPVIKKKMSKGSVVFVSASYKARDFAFYYDIESFKNYNRFAESLAKKSVYFTADDEMYGWEKLNYDTINKIIYVHSHSQVQDPNHKIEAFILSKGLKECSYYNDINTGYTVYIRDSSDCNRINIVSEITNKQCDFFRKYLSVDENNDTCIVYKTSFKDHYKCDPNSVLINSYDSIVRYNVLIDSFQQYGPTIIIPTDELKEYSMLSVKSDFSAEKYSMASLVISLESQGQTFDRQEIRTYDNIKFVKNINWEYTLKKESLNDKELKIYFWNPASGSFHLENMEVIFKRKNLAID
jgi:hypothetical protein